MINLFYVNIALFSCNLAVLVVCLIARARVVSAEKALIELDWENVANLTGDVATIKKTIQKLNNRLNGMEAKDPTASLREIMNHQLVTPNQQNVTNIRKGG
tara:strand:- start:154 stop:456 length:303 start_codon:yes stop_codon:yes gene_type:complete